MLAYECNLWPTLQKQALASFRRTGRNESIGLYAISIVVVYGRQIPRRTFGVRVMVGRASVSSVLVPVAFGDGVG